MSKEFIKDVLKRSGDSRLVSNDFYALNHRIYNMMRREFPDIKSDLTNPSNLKNISVLSGGSSGYKLITMESYMNNLHSSLSKQYNEKCKALDKLEAQNMVNNPMAGSDYTEAYRKLAAEIVTSATTSIVKSMNEGRLAYVGADKEVKLMACYKNDMRPLRAEDVKGAIEDPDTRSIFQKFFDAIKNFLSSGATEQNLEFMTQKDMYELGKAQRKILGKSALEAESANVEGTQAQRVAPKVKEAPKSEVKQEPKKKIHIF